MNAATISTVFVSIALAVSCTKPGAPVEHERGNYPVLEGHEVHRYPIFLDSALSPGRHDLGSLSMGELGVIPVAVVFSKTGEVDDILLQWPSKVVPEEWAMVSHPVYKASGSTVQAAGKSKCKLIHAGGQCTGCSSLIWVEIVIIKTLT
jgi:hypothetical protein